MNSKSIVIGFLMTVISFLFWSKIIPNAFALISKNNILGAAIEITTSSPANLPTILISPTPTPTPTQNPSPTIKSTIKYLPSPLSSPKTSQSPTPTLQPVSMTQLDEWFTKYANKESINKDLLKNIAYCESKYKPEAINGQYGGMYQFTKNTWISTRTYMNLNTDPDLRFNPEEAIKTAAFRIATQGAGAWPNCGK